MDFDDTPEEAAFRAKARAWIAANAPFELEQELASAPFGHLDLKHVNAIKASKVWQRKKYEGGWACLGWPKAFGGQGAPPIQSVIWAQEEGAFSRLGTAFMVSQGSLGPTLMAWGTDRQKQERLPPIVTGDEIWCQLFSEPAAGSDLAGIRLRAEQKTDGQWTLNGQKIWCSGAQDADWGVILTRTDPAAYKHNGLTMFFVDMRAPGVEVRPIRQITEQTHVNEVYFDGVELSDDNRIGPVGGGWKVALTMLMNERITIGGHMSTGFEDLFELATQPTVNGSPAIEDRTYHSRMADYACKANGLRYTYYRALTALSRGKEPGPEMSIMKLVAAPTMQDIATLALDIQGMAGVAMDEDALPNGNRFQMLLLRAAGTRIEGGTDQIMRTIIAERVLGLPQDMRADKDIPFANIPNAKK